MALLLSHYCGCINTGCISPGCLSTVCMSAPPDAVVRTYRSPVYVISSRYSRCRQNLATTMSGRTVFSREITKNNRNPHRRHRTKTKDKTLSGSSFIMQASALMVAFGISRGDFGNSGDFNRGFRASSVRTRGSRTFEFTEVFFRF